MPRIARVVFPGVPHHVTQRGNRREQVFFVDTDRYAYLNCFRKYADRHDLDVLAYCLMPNHVHMVVVPATGHALHRAMKPLHMRYAQHFNRVRRLSGRVWQGRYFSSPLDETYLWNAIRYVELNPVRAKLTNRAEDYPWSSAAGHCGLRLDSLLTSKPWWRRQVEGIGDWSGWLAAGDESESLAVLRRNTVKGLPCGSPSFIDALERATGRQILQRPQGRPRKVGSGKG
jgi:putative transposase